MYRLIIREPTMTCGRCGPAVHVLHKFTINQWAGAKSELPPSECVLAAAAAAKFRLLLLLQSSSKQFRWKFRAKSACIRSLPDWNWKSQNLQRWYNPTLLKRLQRKGVVVWTFCRPLLGCISPTLPLYPNDPIPSVPSPSLIPSPTVRSRTS